MTPIRTEADLVPALRQRIADLGLTHLEVDHRAGIADGLTSKILCGMRRPRAATLMQIFDALGVTLMMVAEEKSPPPHDRALK